jgi:hypothetical protein
MTRQSRTLAAVVLLVLLAGVLAGLAIGGCSRTTPEQSTAPDVQITLSTDPTPPAVGKSTLLITLKDSAGKPIDGAKLSVRGDMDHAGMQPALAEGNQSVNGEYRIPIEWSMGGGWIVTVSATLPDNRTATQKFDLFVEAVSSGSIVNRGKSTATPTVTK